MPNGLRRWVLGPPTSLWNAFVLTQVRAVPLIAGGVVAYRVSADVFIAYSTFVGCALGAAALTHLWLNRSRPCMYCGSRRDVAPLPKDLQAPVQLGLRQSNVEWVCVAHAATWARLRVLADISTDSQPEA